MNTTHLAAVNGDIATLRRLLDEGVYVDDRHNEWGSTPLMFAVQNSNSTSSIETVKFLLEAGANINAINDVNYHSYSVLMFAVRFSNSTSSIETVRFLLDSGADINYFNTVGQTAFMVALEFSDTTSSIETADLLVEYGANPYIYTDHMIDDRVRNLIQKYQWKLMYNNIKLKTRQYSRLENIPEGDPVLPYDVWELILLRQKQRWLCKHLNNSDHKYILLGFAEMLEIPIPENITKAKLCNLISEQLAWGGKYSPDSEKYSNKRYNEVRENIINLAFRMGIDTNQPTNKILDELGLILI